MRNWLGQEIEIGSIVYRGARKGNTSDFKVGKVIGLKPETNKVAVHWLQEESVGIPNIHTVVLIDPSTFSQMARDRHNL